MEGRPPSTAWYRCWRTVVIVYWVSMFLATHLPVQRVVEQLPTTDKHLHFGAYGLLGLLLAGGMRWSGRPAELGLRLCGLLWAYGAADELLQIPVGRSAEFLDWCADVAGAACGIAMGLAWRRFRSSRVINEGHSTKGEVA